MVVIAFDCDVLVREFIDAGNGGVETQSRKLQWLPLDLHLRLLHVIEIEMTVPSSPNELTGLQSAYLGNHAGQEAIRRNVEWDAKECIGTPLIKIAGQPPLIHIELEEGMAWHQRHFVQFAYIPC